MEFLEFSPSSICECLITISLNLQIFLIGGKPIIRNMRIAVEHVLAKLAAGDTIEIILKEHPDLEPEDIQACLLFAHRSLAGEHVHERVEIREVM